MSKKYAGQNPAYFFILLKALQQGLMSGGDYVLGLGAFKTFHQGEFNLLALIQGPVAIASNLTVVNKNIRAVFNGNKAVTLG